METEVTSDYRLSPASGLVVAQYQGASFCKTEWSASTQVLQPLLADLRASNWRAGKQREFLSGPCLQASGLKSRAPMAHSFQEDQDQRCRHSRERRHARCSFAVLECFLANGGAPGGAWSPEESIRSICPSRRQTAERNIPRAREYRLSFRAAAADKSGKHSVGSTSLRGIRDPEPSASSLGWSQRRREHRLALCACCRLPQTHAPARRGAAWVEALMACLQFHRGTECRDPPTRTGR